MSSSALVKAERRMETMRSSAMQKISANRHQVRTAVSSAEILAGAAIAGYADKAMPEGIAGVPTSAGVGLLLLGVGIGMRQPDLSALGLGALCGQAYKFGSTVSA